MEFIDERTIKLDKELSELDRFVLNFCKILEKHTRYIIISGYVTILFGRSRGTEDVDIFIKKMKEQDFNILFEELKKKGYDCINTSKEDAYESLKENVPIRFAKKGFFIPNVEMKFAAKPVKSSLTPSVNRPMACSPFGLGQLAMNSFSFI